MIDSRLRVHALALPGVSEKVLLDRSMFQVRGKTFATESWPEPGWAVVKLPMVEQRRLRNASLAIRPEPERGATGITLLRLAGLDDVLLLEVLAAAWRLAYGPDKARLSGGTDETAGARVAR